MILIIIFVILIVFIITIIAVIFNTSGILTVSDSFQYRRLFQFVEICMSCLTSSHTRTALQADYPAASRTGVSSLAAS